MSIKLHALLLLFCVCLCCFENACACSCTEESLNINNGYQKADVVFVGEIEEAKYRLGAQDGNSFHFKVTEYLKGGGAKERLVYRNQSDARAPSKRTMFQARSSCDPDFSPGMRYIVFAFIERSTANLYVGGCSPTRGGQAADEAIKKLKRRI